jgi:hypothetical protein
MNTAMWKYNMPTHIHLAHPGYSLDSFEDGAPIPDDLALAMLITKEEEERLGIPKENIPPKPSESILTPVPIPLRGAKCTRQSGTGAQTSKRGQK